MFERELKVAIEAVVKASKLTRKVYSTLKNEKVFSKVKSTDMSPVTVADFGAQAIVNAYLLKYFPLDGIVGEEDAADLRQDSNLSQIVLHHVNACIKDDGDIGDMTMEQMFEIVDRGKGNGGGSGRFWTCDPIDGTKGYLRGDQYAVCLALILDGKVKVGVLACPNLSLGLSDTISVSLTGDDINNNKNGVLFCAVDGQGSFISSLQDTDKRSKITTSQTSNVKDAILCESVESSHSNHNFSSQLVSKLEMDTLRKVRMDSQCKYGLLACGNADLFLRVPTSTTYKEKIWDHAAGCLIVSEAGGKVTDFDGLELDFSKGRILSGNKPGILASNGSSIHQVILNTIPIIE